MPIQGASATSVAHFSLISSPSARYLRPEQPRPSPISQLVAPPWRGRYSCRHIRRTRRRARSRRCNEAGWCSCGSPKGPSRVSGALHSTAKEGTEHRRASTSLLGGSFLFLLQSAVEVRIVKGHVVIHIERFSAKLLHPLAPEPDSKLPPVSEI